MSKIGSSLSPFGCPGEAGLTIGFPFEISKKDNLELSDQFFFKSVCLQAL
jgi:hypothetical protein